MIFIFLVKYSYISSYYSIMSNCLNTSSIIKSTSYKSIYSIVKFLTSIKKLSMSIFLMNCSYKKYSSVNSLTFFSISNKVNSFS